MLFYKKICMFVLLSIGGWCSMIPVQNKKEIQEFEITPSIYHDLTMEADKDFETGAWNKIKNYYYFSLKSFIFSKHDINSLVKTIKMANVKIMRIRYYYGQNLTDQQKRLLVKIYKDAYAYYMKLNPALHDALTCYAGDPFCHWADMHHIRGSIQIFKEEFVSSLA